MPKPIIESDSCVGCGACVDVCAYDVIDIVDGTAEVASPDYCIACKSCYDTCPTGAITEVEA